MTSKIASPNEAFVWVWLPGATAPVVAGRLVSEGPLLVFLYGKSYLGRKDAIPLYEKELPLKPGKQPLGNGLTMPGCLRDASPDAWGRRVILNRLFSIRGKTTDTIMLSELKYMLESGSDRIGAIDFQESSSKYVARTVGNATLKELQEAAALVEKGMPLPDKLSQALQHGSAIGGARPKVLICDGTKNYIAKFSSSSDVYNVVKAEFVAMRLAKAAGINVATVKLERSLGKDVILIQRFDRHRTNHGFARINLISALTLFGLDEMMARYASYETLAEIIRYQFKDPDLTLKELFGRMVFNILCGNTDDHARNHAALWDGKSLTMSPAYDICPQSRAGNEATQAMLIDGKDNFSRIATCLRVSENFHLSRESARSIVEYQVAAIAREWRQISDEAELTPVDRSLLWGRAFLNPFAFEGLTSEDSGIVKAANKARSENV